MTKRLSVSECEKMFKEFATPPHIRRHCFAVARAAVILAREMNEHGYSFDIKLVRGAALMHDLVRLKTDHAMVAANILRERGYEEEADIVSVHMDYDMVKTMKEITEVDLVCFGDRVVKEDKFVGLAERMDYVVDKAKGHEEAIKRIRARQKDTEILLKEVEGLIGMSIEELMREKGDVNEFEL
ncbi:MAG: HD domain-containing protein [Eubacteriales bacterium]